MKKEKTGANYAVLQSPQLPYAYVSSMHAGLVTGYNYTVGHNVPYPKQDSIH